MNTRTIIVFSEFGAGVYTCSHFQTDHTSVAYAELDWSLINQYRSKVALFWGRIDFDPLEAGKPVYDDECVQKKSISLSGFFCEDS